MARRAPLSTAKQIRAGLKKGGRVGYNRAVGKAGSRNTEGFTYTRKVKGQVVTTTPKFKGGKGSRYNTATGGKDT